VVRAGRVELLQYSLFSVFPSLIFLLIINQFILFLFLKRARINNLL